jgi:hypothetical protein
MVRGTSRSFEIFLHGGAVLRDFFDRIAQYFFPVVDLLRNRERARARHQHGGRDGGIPLHNAGHDFNDASLHTGALFRGAAASRVSRLIPACP